jgi:phage terminase small subunit
MCALLTERRALTKGDRELIRLYVLIRERHKRNFALLEQEGEVVTYTRLDSNGQGHDQEKANLRLKIVADAERQLVAILKELGLTPIAKDRAKPTSGTSANEVVPGSIADTDPEFLAEALKIHKESK